MYVLKCFPKKVIHSYECVQVGILATNGFNFVFKCHKHGTIVLRITSLVLLAFYSFVPSVCLVFTLVCQKYTLFGYTQTCELVFDYICIGQIT